MTPNIPLSYFLPAAYLLSSMTYIMGYPFGHFGSAVPLLSPPNFLLTPSLLAGGAS